MSNNADIQALDDNVFSEEVQRIVKLAEDTRMSYMSKYQARQSLFLSLTLFLVVAGAGGFGWFFLVDPRFFLAFLCLLVMILPTVSLTGWVEKPLKSYKRDYKEVILPEIAKALGGMRFYPNRGLNKKLLAQTRIVPAHSSYRAEDFFMGKYKGVKLMLGEARLGHPKKHAELIFDGLFVLMEMPQPVFQGLSIVSADNLLMKRLMQKMNPIAIRGSGAEDTLAVVSTSDERPAFLTNTLLQKIEHMSELFQNSQLSVSFFKKKYMFMMIPNQEDMFEASSLYVPVASGESAMRCKKEVEQLLSIVDLWDEGSQDSETSEQVESSGVTHAGQTPTQPLADSTEQAPGQAAPYQSPSQPATVEASANAGVPLQQGQSSPLQSPVAPAGQAPGQAPYQSPSQPAAVEASANAGVPLQQGQSSPLQPPVAPAEQAPGQAAPPYQSPLQPAAVEASANAGVPLQQGQSSPLQPPVAPAGQAPGQVPYQSPSQQQDLVQQSPLGGGEMSEPRLQGTPEAPLSENVQQNALSPEKQAYQNPQLSENAAGSSQVKGDDDQTS